MKKRKIINDPVHGTIVLEGPLLELAQTPEVMRLTGIHQLGMAYLVFPGAHHKRFEHSLGTSHVAGLLASALDLPPEEAMLVRVAGLLHDLGHGPYSHTLESVFHERIGMDHMEITSELITGKVEPWDLHWWEGYENLERGRSIPEILESFDL
ncbi:MAG: HD domain-containing protein, partial [Thermoplasmata archaeon]|nr:HD domain-containing protein [Thermoplasmata archaeon]